MANSQAENNYTIADDPALLDLMMQGTANAPEIYQPGPFWLNKTRAAVKEIKNSGLSTFRGISSGIAASYGDSAFTDTRSSYDFGIRSVLAKLYRDVFPFNRLFDSQVNLTRSYFGEYVIYVNEYLKGHPRVKEILEKHPVNFETTRGGCVTCLDLGGRKLSHHYLQLLDTIDRVQEDTKFQPESVFFEIGGGFGANAHLLVELFGVRKIIYLDIPPNLYVATQYLKSFFGDGVKDYKANQGKPIAFENNDKLEIFCITPPQIEDIDAKVDIFHNAHSFVEMPKFVVSNYAQHVNRILRPNRGVVSLVSYDAYDLDTTFHPNELPSYFNGVVKAATYGTLRPSRSDFHFVVAKT